MGKINDVIKEICEKWDITEEDLKSKSRLNVFVKARKEVSKKLREVGLSQTSIAMFLNRKNRGTISYYFKKQKIDL